ncbi:MAG: DUF1997 domain-containing protein [Cyanobacteria bacterium J069]|nr:MAG: DUF1997 domain-containing protein [Cyanobacteria bacterium J069]
MQTRFFASQSVELNVPEQPIPIHHYLRQPHRLITALVDPSRVETLGGDRFRLKMRPLTFFTLSLQPTVDIDIWADAEGGITLRSVGSEILGVEYINERFHLDLTGQLMPVQTRQGTRLLGQANLQVEVGLPPAFWVTPRPLLEATGNGLLRSVLGTVKQRLMHQLLVDYGSWVQAQLAQPACASLAFAPDLATD